MAKFPHVFPTHAPTNNGKPAAALLFPNGTRIALMGLGQTSLAGFMINFSIQNFLAVIALFTTLNTGCASSYDSHQAMDFYETNPRLRVQAKSEDSNEISSAFLEAGGQVFVELLFRTVLILH